MTFLTFLTFLTPLTPLTFLPPELFHIAKFKRKVTDKEKFPQQEAPEKNTDQAFVQVGRDGHPVMPGTAGDTNEDGKIKSPPPKK